jgi:hypothetical protein
MEAVTPEVALARLSLEVSFRVSVEQAARGLGGESSRSEEEAGEALQATAEDRSQGAVVSEDRLLASQQEQ